jgi:hypothetical protein
MNSQEKADELYIFFSNKIQFQIKDRAVVKSLAKSCAIRVVKEMRGVKTGQCSHSKVDWLEYLAAVEMHINSK